jgi:shikimate 5-dehydrogenase
MLVNQAAHSYKMWFGVLPDIDPVLKDIEAMRE